MTITIISVGTRPKDAPASLVKDFVKRLPKHVHIDWVYVAHGHGSPDISKQQEAEHILRKIPAKATCILLDERGAQVSSPEFARQLFGKSGDVCFIIGGAYGVASSVQDRAKMIWSLGKLVYPHQLVRVLLAEQIYRAHAIHSGHPYHHE